MIQDLPSFYDFQYTKEEGTMTSDAYLYNDQTFQALNLLVQLVNKLVLSKVDQGNTTPKGLVVPSQTEAEISNLVADAKTPVGTIWYDTTNNVLKCLVLASPPLPQPPLPLVRTLKTIQTL